MPGVNVKKHRKLKIFGVVVVLLLLAAFIGMYAMVQFRTWQAQNGQGAVAVASMPTEIKNSADADGRINAHAEYDSIAAPGKVQTDFVWDDAWFFQDPTVYNHELATACSILSAVAISESEYYQKGSNAPAYVENVMAQLGFEHSSTASYQYRSEVEDEVVNIFDQKTDVTAYSICSKHITNQDTGDAKLLIVTSVRGTYGSEWLSNLKFGTKDGLVEDMGLGEGDHEGFSDAAGEVSSAVIEYIENLEKTTGETIDRTKVALLFTGHSRGAATANMAAAYLDEICGDLNEAAQEDAEVKPGIETSNIFAYAFATPEVTLNTDCRNAKYNNIFNILNPADIVPRMPLNAWGFDRYGIDYWLPEPGTDDFDAKYTQFKELFHNSMNCDSQYDPADAANVDKLISDLSSEVPTLKDFESAGGVFKTIGSLVSDTDAVRVIQAHVPNVYIAWMQEIQQTDLRTSR